MRPAGSREFVPWAAASSSASAGPAALLREFREEIGIEVTVTGQPFVLENIYVHNGAPGPGAKGRP